MDGARLARGGKGALKPPKRSRVRLVAALTLVRTPRSGRPMTLEWSAGAEAGAEALGAMGSEATPASEEGPTGESSPNPRNDIGDRGFKPAE